MRERFPGAGPVYTRGSFWVCRYKKVRHLAMTAKALLATLERTKAGLRPGPVDE